MGIKGFFGRLMGKSNLQNTYDRTGASELLIQPYSMAGRFGWMDVRQCASWQYYKEISVIRNAVDMGATNFTSVPFVIRDKKTREIYREFDPHIEATNILKLLEAPNEDISESEFKCSHYKSYHVTGETFIMATVSESTAEPLELFYVNPRRVNAETDSNDVVQSFSIYTGQFSGQYYRHEMEDRIVYVNSDRNRYLWQHRVLNPDQGNDNGRGFSPLSSVYYEIEQFSGVSRHNNSLLRNGVRPSGAIIPNTPNDHIGSSLTDEQVQSLRQNVQSFYGGYNNTGNVMILDGIKEFKQLSMNNRDMEFTQLIERTTEQIYRSLGIPLPLVNAKTMTLRNYQEAKYMLYDMAIIPYAIAYAEEMTRFLMPFYDSDSRYELIVDTDKIHALEARKLEKIEAFKDSMTDNEIREFLNLDPIEGGNIIRGQEATVMADTKSKEDFITALQDRGISYDDALTKANKIYGCH